ncbi:hypothetical protein FA15DRAFT_704644 [Coprinopsis marcescibilis]|uniref:Uncharacterized protein n=1 Tax=Coprinopsis marcescibilis TaxID=230819 RepID=A0A5C3KWQ6_COPMA|nr:hypothetical protein FA15DRAFT_704644 [Coprinopsis marcescibilis]
MIEDHLGLDASTRYFTHKNLCGGARSIPFGEFVDPNRALEAMLDGEFIHGYDNCMEYFERLTDSSGSHYVPPFFICTRGTCILESDQHPGAPH